MNANLYKKPFLVLGVALFAVLLNFGFQNCSGQNYDILASGEGENFFCEGNICTEKFSADVTAGQQDLPPLKMFFIVDNSFTMKANQVNLSSSFGKMFESAINFEREL